MSGIVHAFALARAEGISAGELLPYATGIGDLLAPIITEFAERADTNSHAGDNSTIASAAAGMEHIISTGQTHGLEVSVLGAAHAIARRAIEFGHGSDGFSRLVDVIASGQGAPQHV